MSDTNCCCARKTQRTDEDKKKLINRLSRIEGQIRGIRKMIENDAYCADVLTQSAAANAAIKSFNKELLEHHISSCVVSDILDGDESAPAGLVSLIEKLM